MTIMTRRAAVTATAAMLSAPLVRAQPRPIRIGMIQPMSGALSNYGQQGQPALDYVVKQINAGGGIKRFGGAAIELVLADDASQPARSATEARRLITQERVAMLMGTMTTPQSLAIGPVIDELKVPAVSIWAGTVRASHLYSLGLAFDLGYARPIADFAGWLNRERGYGLKTAVMAFSNYEAGQQVNGFLKTRLKAHGIEVIDEVPLDTRAQDLTPAMVRIRSRKPDLVAGLILPRDGVLLQQARHSLAVHEPVFLSPGYGDISFWHDLGAAIGDVVLTRNLFALVGVSPGARLPALRRLVEEIQRQPGLHLSTAALQTAQAGRVLQAVLESAEAPEPAAVQAALARFHLPAGDPNLYLACPDGMRFGPDRMLTESYGVIVQWRADKGQEVVYPAQFAGGEPRPRAR